MHKLFFELHLLDEIKTNEFNQILSMYEIHSFDNLINKKYNTAVYTNYNVVYKIIDLPVLYNEFEKIKKIQTLLWNIYLINDYMDINIYKKYIKHNNVYLIYKQPYIKPFFNDHKQHHILFYKLLLNFQQELQKKFNDIFKVQKYQDKMSNCTQYVIMSKYIKIYDLTYKNISLNNNKLFIYDCNTYLTFDNEML